MKISQKLEYACRAVFQLAKRHHENTVTRLDEIAQCEDVSSNFLVQIMNDLKNAEVVHSKRGKSGGYFIKKSLDEITLYDIVAAVEPAMLNQVNDQSGESAKEVANAWGDISNQFGNSLKKKTLEQLLSSNDAPMFYI